MRYKVEYDLYAVNRPFTVRDTVEDFTIATFKNGDHATEYAEKLESGSVKHAEIEVAGRLMECTQLWCCNDYVLWEFVTITDSVYLVTDLQNNFKALFKSRNAAEYFMMPYTE